MTLWRAALLTITAFHAAMSALAQSEWKQLPPLPEPLGVAAPFAGECEDKLIVAGGANFPDKMPWEGGKKIWHDRVWLLDGPNEQWRETGKLPRPLAYGVSVSYGNEVFAIGGSDADRHYADCFRLSLHGGKFAATPIRPLPSPLANHCGAVILRHFLYVACGAERPGEQSATNRVFALDLQRPGANWIEKPPLPGKPRILAVAAAEPGEFYVIGGVALEPQADGKIARSYLRDVWRYTLDERWKRLADLPKPIAAAPSPAPVIAGKIHILAGDDGSLAGFTPVEKHPGFPRTILTYDVANDKWSESGEVPAPRATVPCVPWRERFVIPSGEVRPGVRSPEVWSLRTSTQ